jgi:hypothetical protein
MFFQSLLIEYSKRLHFEKATIKDTLETDLSFATIDWYSHPHAAKKVPTYVRDSTCSSTPLSMLWREMERCVLMRETACPAA